MLCCCSTSNREALNNASTQSKIRFCSAYSRSVSTVNQSTIVLTWLTWFKEHIDERCKKVGSKEIFNYLNALPPLTRTFFRGIFESFIIYAKIINSFFELLGKQYLGTLVTKGLR
jgi:hypothetical protein